VTATAEQGKLGIKLFLYGNATGIEADTQRVKIHVLSVRLQWVDFSHEGHPRRFVHTIVERHLADCSF